MSQQSTSYLDAKALGTLARELRIQAKLSQQDVARQIGSSQPNVSAAEHGDDTRYIMVAINIIQCLSTKIVTGPYYLLVESRHDLD
jgi:DNA-binding XRE family transcriptional regulator